MMKRQKILVTILGVLVIAAVLVITSVFPVNRNKENNPPSENAYSDSEDSAKDSKSDEMNREKSKTGHEEHTLDPDQKETEDRVSEKDPTSKEQGESKEGSEDTQPGGEESRENASSDPYEASEGSSSQDGSEETAESTESSSAFQPVIVEGDGEIEIIIPDDMGAGGL